jgi:hypothetical protein
MEQQLRKRHNKYKARKHAPASAGKASRRVSEER